ncbi:MAG: Holliday junction branch migration protein RuvA [Christensenellales bacterium]|jgi:Holliday junction DNA helicase RuvA
MIDFVNGKLIKKEQGCAVVEVGGIGFMLQCSSSTLCGLPDSGDVRLYTHLIIKEDGISLYGFKSAEERAMFLRLITVSGVGPKVSLSLLSAMSPGALALAILTCDTKALCKTKGLGKKTAERIFLELKEKIVPEEFPDSDVFASTLKLDADVSDAVIALKTLGFGQSEAFEAVKKAKPAAKSIEELIALALKYLSV